jgi:F-type H+-transporting ATPase subunit gamma
MRITRAMELISASRIVRAQQRVRQSRPYAELITGILSAVTSRESDLAHDLLEQRPERRAAAVFVVTSDRGLCGGYNSNALRTAEELFAKLRLDGVEPRLYVTGRKGLSYFRFRDRPIAGSWTGFSEQPTYEDARTLGEELIRAFVAGEVDEIHGVYTDFQSVLTQRPVARRFVPLEFVEVQGPVQALPLYLFEPGPEALLAKLLPRYVEERVYSSMLESAASEQAARRRAMSAATSNAEELIKVYTRVANQARQAEITQEIMEVVGGAEAMAGRDA